MKAVAYKNADPISAGASLVGFEADTPSIGPKGLLVEARAISVNLVDSKIRSNVSPESGLKIIGYDAGGVVKVIGNSMALA